MISVVIPVKNGGNDLERCLDALARQVVDDEVEIVVVDSGSSDGSDDLARRRGARVERIPPAEFHHGRTRNLGAQRARGDILVFTSQDAFAASDGWLARLTGPLRSGDESVAGVYGRQLPHRDARPPERYFLDFLYGPATRIQRMTEPGVLTLEQTLFSNVSSAIPRRVWERFPFADDVVMSEDQDARGEIRWLWETDQRRWIPYATVYELAKFVGLQLGRRHRLLPTVLKTRLSAYPDYWRR